MNIEATFSNGHKHLYEDVIKIELFEHTTILHLPKVKIANGTNIQHSIVEGDKRIPLR